MLSAQPFAFFAFVASDSSCFFFFSSRRRHTRYWRDWSSDVCSSDLRTHCITVMGERTKADVVSMRLSEGDKLQVEGVSLDVLYTPGHTDDSYSFLMADRVFTGDTLLIRGTGRTDFQNGDARAQYESIFGKLLKLPDETLVYPAHDYKGDTVSTIGEERRCNPRLQVKSADEYA